MNMNTLQKTIVFNTQPTGTNSMDHFHEQTSSKKTTFNMCTSLIDELKEKKEQVYEKRTKAFEKLTDTTEFKTRLRRTQMCKSVAQKKPCRHGKHCRFAHNVDELEIADCAFGMDCRFVRRHGEVYGNCSRRRKCKYKHPGESKQAFFERIGETKHPAVKSEPEPVTLSRISKRFAIREIERIAKQIDEGEVNVISVYKEITVEITELMSAHVSRGGSPIRIEII